MKQHVSSPDSVPLLIFPEGTCVNNEYTVLFKRGAFELGAAVCPIAINVYAEQEKEQKPFHIIAAKNLLYLKTPLHHKRQNPAAPAHPSPAPFLIFVFQFQSQSLLLPLIEYPKISQKGQHASRTFEDSKCWSFSPVLWAMLCR
eukprot:scaffold256266_cov24-Tisochrysis_lutea.AAC.1